MYKEGYVHVSIHRGQKTILDPLKLELHAYMLADLGAGNQTWALWKSRSYS